jgi:hypothetical protein
VLTDEVDNPKECQRRPDRMPWSVKRFVDPDVPVRRVRVPQQEAAKVRQPA